MNFEGINWAQLHFLSVSFMCGVIWIIQLIHYPLMGWVSKEHFENYHSIHSKRITWIVGPMMILQLVSSLLLTQNKWIFVGLSAGVFLETFFLSVPCHNRLARGFDEATLERLVQTNWLRTLTWTAHLILFMIL